MVASTIVALSPGAFHLVTTPLQEISELLAGMSAPGAFAVRRTSAASDLRLDVKGVGRITRPISKSTARKLCAAARPAHYGWKDQTRLDPRVRDTFEIPKARVRIDERTWRNTFRPVLDRIRRNLGLPDGTSLEAELHSMLVYGPGQFFAGHQDSEKGDGMVGTLVVVLPSAFNRRGHGGRAARRAGRLSGGQREADVHRVLR